MDTKQIEYIIKIAEERNITHAAEKLFITPSALNQQLLKLEKELGTQLFYRSRNDCQPTKTGEIYLKNAREMLRIKRETYSMIADVSAAQKGRLSVGFTPGRGIVMFTGVYPAFHHLHPDIIVEPTELSVRNQQNLISRGELDIGFVTLSEKQKSGDEYITLYEEDIVLAIPSGHPLGTLAAPAGAPLAELDISLLKYEPFVLMYKESTIRNMVDDIFRQADFTPNVLFETSNTTTIVAMIRSNLCCGVIPRYYTKDVDGMACFYLPSHPTWKVAASYRKASYLSKAAKDFIRLASDFWSE